MTRSRPSPSSAARGSQSGTVARQLDAQAVIPRELAGTELLGELGRRGRQELLVIDERGLVFGVLLLADVDAALHA